MKHGTMKHAVAIVIAALSMSAAVATAAAAGAAADHPIDRRIKPGWQRLRVEDLQANIYFLASDALLGRMSLQPGDDAAADWVAAEFAKAGLAPAARNAAGQLSYLQPVPLIEYRTDREASFVSLQRGGQLHRWYAPEAIGGFHDDIDVSGELVFAGFGITAPGMGYDDYRNLDAK